ncbi:hypothetical protein EST92_16715 [Streptomyces sp. TM32]|uniref:IPT/TIG domain-containing protein n=1 Tax=Streptomyces sp. TM32 TaxID=1652669 RepID=UPI0010132E29|nr:IPT/TIG domain-containing protein [Streptomyces sp. TM32]RXS80938.1 hypothetical protein EST92_16715 [Streptomyces sp. TM32]
MTANSSPWPAPQLPDAAALSAMPQAAAFLGFGSPALLAVVLPIGPTTGGNQVTLLGSGFSGTTVVRFGLTSATSFVVVSDNIITAVVPPGVGIIPVTVTTSHGTSNGFPYIYVGHPAPPAVITSISPTCGLTTGGNTVTINGSGFTGATAVSFGPHPATSFSVVNDNTITAVAPPGTGTVPVTVTTPGGTSNAVNYTYQTCELAVPNWNNNTLSFFDPQTLTITGTIGVGPNPWRVAVSPTMPRAYVTNQNNGVTPSSVSVIDLTTHTVIATIPIPGASNCIGVVVSPDGSKVYVVNVNGSSVSVINTATNTITNTITGFGVNPVEIALNPAGSKAYVTNNLSTSVSVVDTATNTITNTIAVGNLPWGVAFSSDGTKAYVVNGGDGTLSVIDTASETVTATIPGPGSGLFNNIALKPDGTRAYITNYDSGTVSVVNLTTNTVIATIPGFTNPWGVAISPNGSRVYVTDYTTSLLSVIDTATNTVISSTPGFAGPGELAVIGCGPC